MPVWPQGKILGLIFLELKTHYLKQSLEIKYLATVGGLAQILPDPQLKKVRGVGTFLVAGTWLLWKSCFPQARELVLNAEIGAIALLPFHRFSSRAAPSSMCSRSPRDFCCAAFW